jgi:hypothetical protein
MDAAGSSSKSWLTLYYTTHRDVSGDSNLEGSYSSDDLDLYSRRDQFESRPDSGYTGCDILWFSFPPKNIGILLRSGQRCFLPNSFQIRYLSTGPLFVNRDSSVSIATGYGMDDRGFGIRVPVKARIFSSPRGPDRFWGLPRVPGALSPGGR